MALIQKMIKNREQKGYTILEVMIVLSVSAVIFIAAVTGYASQNSKTHFTNAVRDMENKIQDILNDVSTGYYPNTDNFDCTRSGSSPAHPVINPLGTSQQGTNQDCIFLGKAVDVNDGAMDSYTIVGLRNSKDNVDLAAADIEDAENRIVPSNIDGSYDRLDLNASIHIDKIVDDTLAESAGFALVSGFGHGDIGGAGSITNQVAIASIDPLYDFANGTSKVVGDLGRSVTICIEEPGNGRRASITIGAGGQTDIETIIDDWAGVCN